MYNQDTHVGPSFSLRNRFARMLWGIVMLLFFQTSPKPMHAWRACLLRAFGAKVGKRVHVYPKVKIWAPWNLYLSDECGVADGAILYSMGEIRIGVRAVISQGVHLCGGTHDYSLPGFPLITMPISVGDYAWIAAESFVHPGVKIGNGCVVGARAVVVNDMPAWTVCAGHPCKPLKKRVMREEGHNDSIVEIMNTPI